MSTPIAAAGAHALHERGFHVFPVDHPDHADCIGKHGPTSPCDGHRGKHPAVKFGTWAVTVTAQMIDLEWGKRGGVANIGVACGPTNLVVLDEDQAGELARWCDAYGIVLPATYTVTTDRGEHLYFRWNHATKRIGNGEKAFAGFKVNVRGDGGYVVGEGSQHESGAIYAGNGRPIAELPEEVAAILLAGQHDEPIDGRRSDSEAFLGGAGAGNPNETKIVDGERHNALVAYAGRLRGLGLDRTEAEAAFRQRWLLCEQPEGQIAEARFHGSSCRYPVTWAEALGKLRDVYQRYPAGDVGAELGDHRHERGDAVPGSATIDEDAFWTAYPELADCRRRARARRVGPWATLGAALVKASATIPPFVVLPATVGDYASVNLYAALAGVSGTAKSAAITAADAWLSTVPDPPQIKPGSGQGIAKSFAYIQRDRGNEPKQIGKTWTAVAVVAEVDTLAAAGGLSSSSLWAELRSAWSDERVGHDYSDGEKTVVLRPRRYRLSLIVGVQPLHAGPLLDDVDGGTPQRFVWFPVGDAGAPDHRPEPPDPMDLPRWPEPEPRNPKIDTHWAQSLHKPADRAELTVLGVPPEAVEAIDRVAREKLRGNPGVDPLDGHRLLCQLKVAAALMRLCNRFEVTSKDWELAGVVMAVSDRTRRQVQAEREADQALRNVAAAQASGARRIIETRMTAEADAADVARVAAVIVAALERADGHTLSGAKVRKALGRERDRVLMDRALDYLKVDGRVTVEDVEYRGNAGTKVTLLDDEEQTK